MWSEARELKRAYAKEVTDIKNYPPEDDPVSVFMAGSPGAGKTEVAKWILRSQSRNNSIIHIDPDEIRKRFSGYTGENAELFQGAVASVVDRIHDHLLDNSQSFIFDGTLSDYDQARKNIERSLKKERNRSVVVVYVYQDPLQAWKFVQARKGVEGRRVPRDSFIRQYFDARTVVNALAMEYKGRVQFDLIIKNIDGSIQKYHESFQSVDELLPESYSKEDLEKLIV